MAALTLQQFRLDSRDSSSTSSDIEVCVESVLAPDTDSACCELLLSRYRKQKFWGRWKFHFLRRTRPRFGDDELRGIQEQANDSATSESRRLRRRFLLQFSNLAAFSLRRLQLCRLFTRWQSRFDLIRLRRIQTSAGIALDRRKTQERVLHHFRTTLIRRRAAKLSEAERSYSQISQGDRLRDLVDELARSEQRNLSLENEITAKSRELSDLQSNLRRLVIDVHDTSKRLKEIRESTGELQRSFAATERRYQEEIAALRAQLSLEGSDESRELETIDAAVRTQHADRRADYAFADDAQLSALQEIEQHEEKLRTAEKVVRSLEEMLGQSHTRQNQLAKTRAALADEVATLRIRKGQLEQRIATNEILGTNREGKIRKMLQEAKAQLEAANVRIDGQAEQIKSKQKEIELLQQDIEAQKKGIQTVQSRFLQNVSPRHSRGRTKSQRASAD